MNKPIDCPGDGPLRTLACAVIYRAAKDYARSRKQLESFFLGPDYRFWANMAGIRVNGEMMLASVTEHGGIAEPAYFRPYSGGE